MLKAIELVEQAGKRGEVLTLDHAIRKLHAEYIRRQLNNKYGVKSSGFLILSGLYSKDEDGWKKADKALLRIFDNFIAGENKLTGESGVKLREAMDKMGIDYLHCPFFPLQPLDIDAA
jgi:hypothetical protein